MLVARKRTLSLDSVDSEQRMAKRVRREWLPQSSPAPAATKVDSRDRSRNLTPSAPLSTATSTPSASSPPKLPLIQCSNKLEPSLSASPSSSSDSLSPSMSPASLLSSLTPRSSPPNATSISSPAIAPKASLPLETTEELLTCSSADDVPTDMTDRLTARYQDNFRRIWSGSMLLFQTTTDIYDLLVRLGLWTGTTAELTQLGCAFPDMKKVYLRTLASGDLREISAHPAFFNPIHSAIDNIMLRCDDVFREILNGVLPSAAMVRLAEIDPKALGSLQDLDCSAQTGNVKLIDELFSKQRSYITASSARKTRLLYQGLHQYWGLYFSFSATTYSDEGSLPSTSADLAFAITLLKSSSASATESITESSSNVNRVFYALYLARILVLQRFLDSLPPVLSESQARKEWLCFQLAPPRISSGVDIFTTVLKAIAEGELKDLRRCAECKLMGLGWRNHKWFSKSFSAVYRREGAYVDVRKDGIPPLYIAIDEIETPVREGLKPRAARRAARRRAQVYSLFCQPHSP